jgi:5-formyltetrahydrofolate cyclo-ligase
VDGAEVKVWRRTERERLIAERMAAPAAMRREWGERIAATLWEMLAGLPGPLGVYWPFRGEFDPRPLIEAEVARGRVIALPVVIDKKGPLEYRAWKPGEPLVAGVWDIPVPESRQIAVPGTVLAPLVGFDPACYRLGYGGGYFDRTLAALRPRPLAIGVGFAFQEIATIHPQDFDIPMDMVITEAGLRRRELA